MAAAKAFCTGRYALLALKIILSGYMGNDKTG
jgi:hypothetical protein